MSVKRAGTSFIHVRASAEDFVFEASGGTITFSGGYKIHTFTAAGSDNFTVLSGQKSVDYLIVAGGGGGGFDVGGGGGAGGYRSSSLAMGLGTYPVVVGAGGAGSPTNNVNAQQGENSVFSSITSTGGGKGGNWANPSTFPGAPGNVFRNGGPGGSGGGGGGWTQTSVGGSGVSGEGNPGGSHPAPTNGTGASGGGAGSPGLGPNPSSSASVAGGSGVSNSISGSPITYSVGGRGMGDIAPGPQNGTTNRGNGADGGGSPNPGSNGGPGIVVVRYLI